MKTTQKNFEISSFLIKWTPRAIAVGIGGYYCLGFAYEVGLMALIDKLAIPILKSFVGYAGVGFVMPSFQWHSAWAIRILSGLSLGLVYDQSEKGIHLLVTRISNSYFPTENTVNPSPV